MKSGFLKVCAISPRVTVAGVQSNLNAALQEIEKAKKNKVQILVFPELFLSGYTCGDLFLQTALQDACKSVLTAVCRATENSALVVVIGLPLKFGTSLYNCAAVVQNGIVVAVVPKTYIPNYNEYYEKRWFASGDGVNGTIKLNGQEVPFGQTLVRLSDDAVLGVEICEDLWTPSSPSTALALSGANIIINLSASNEVVTKNDYRKNLICMQSAKDFCAYIYASAGVGESTTDLVFSGACTVAENGALLAEGERFAFNGSMAEACIDIEKLNEIMAGPDGIATGYSFEGQMLGHIIQGVKTIDRLTLELGFPREKAIMLEHMILAHHYEPEFGSPKKPLFPEAEVLHYLDILDARMFDMEDALVSTEPGTFSERIWALDNRRIYKTADAEDEK